MLFERTGPQALLIKSAGLHRPDSRALPFSLITSAARKHKLEEGTTHQHRKKVSKLVLSGDVARNRDGTGAREDGATGSGMDVGGANESRINVGASGSGLNIGASGSGLNVGARCTRSRNRSSVYMRVAWVIRWYEWLSECINLVY